MLNVFGNFNTPLGFHRIKVNQLDTAVRATI